MVLFPDMEEPEDVVVEVLADTSGGFKVIGEYRPKPGRRFVRIDDLVPDHIFYYRMKIVDGRSAREPMPFSIGESIQGTSVGGGGLGTGRTG